MNILRDITVMLMLIILSPDVFACSFRTGYEVAEPRPDWIAPRGPVPNEPNIELVSIERGHDDGSPGSCSDAGMLILKVEPNKDISGFSFRIVKGSFPDTVLPDYYVTPVKLEMGLGFMFVWLDLPHGKSSVESIDVLIEVTQISSQGQESSPTKIRAFSAGGKTS